MNNDIQYAIVATTFNDAKGITRYLDNITKQTKKPCEIVIADGGSNDETISIIKQFQSVSPIPIKLIVGGRMNIAEGYNAAIKASKASYIGVTGIGNVYEEAFFEKLCGKIDQLNCDMVYSLLRGQDNNEFSTLYNKALLNGDKGRKLQIPSNRGALIKKNIFESLDHFYEKFIYAGEDAEFYYLAVEKGYKAYCDDSAIMYWETPKSMKVFLKQVENYTIGNMQIDGFRKMIKSFKYQLGKIVLVMILIMGIILSVLVKKYMIAFAIVALWAVYFFAKVYRNGIAVAKLQWFNSYMPFVYMIKHREYFSDEYQVKR